MHDGMPYDPIQGQGHGHECLEATRGINRQSRMGLNFCSVVTSALFPKQKGATMHV